MSKERLTTTIAIDRATAAAIKLKAGGKPIHEFMREAVNALDPVKDPSQAIERHTVQLAKLNKKIDALNLIIRSLLLKVVETGLEREMVQEWLTSLASGLYREGILSGKFNDELVKRWQSIAIEKHGELDARMIKSLTTISVTPNSGALAEANSVFPELQGLMMNPNQAKEYLKGYDEAKGSES